MRVACIQYKSYEDEKKTLKKLIPLIYSAAKKKVDLITLPECATFLNVKKSDTMMNSTFEKNSFSLNIIKEIAKNLNVNIGRYNFDTIHYDYYRDETVALEAFKSGAYDFISKPPDLNRLLTAVRNALQIKNLVLENKNLKR